MQGPQQEATTVNLAELPLGVRTLFVAVGTKIWSGGLLRHLVAEWGVDLAAADAIYYEVQNETLLHVAARQGKADVVAALLDEGADMNKGDCKSGCIPLMTAAGEVRWGSGAGSGGTHCNCPVVNMCCAGVGWESSMTNCCQAHVQQ